MRITLLLGTTLLAWSLRTPWLQARRSPAVLRINPSSVTAAIKKSASYAPDPRALNGMLTKTTSARELLELHAQYGSVFDHVNLATCWSRLGRVRAGGERRWLLSDGGARLGDLREQTSERVRRFDARGLSSTAHALAKLSLRGTAWASLWNDIERAALARRRKFEPMALATTAWAFATADHAAPALFEAIAEEASGRVHEFNPQALANTAWAFATAGHAAPALLEAIAEEAARRVREFIPQALASTAWAYAASNHYAVESTLFDQRFARHCDALAHEFNSKDLRQLHQWRLWYKFERGCSDGLPGAALLARCDAAFRASEVTVSRLQRQVAETLVLLGASVQEEVVLQEGYSLDLVVDWRGERLAVEVDGPSHFVGREPTSATRLKRRQLEHFGWWLVSVPYWEWDELGDKKTTREQRAVYLSTLLDEALRQAV